MEEEESSSPESMDDGPLFEQMDIEARLRDMKMGDDILRSISLYFELPAEYMQELPGLDDDRYDEEFLILVGQAVTIDILRNRDVNDSLFEMIFQRCTMLGKDVVIELDILILCLIENFDYFSAFIRFWSILSDFILFLNFKGNMLNLSQNRLLYFWSEYYDIVFEDLIADNGGLEAIKVEAHEFIHNVLDL